MMVFPAHAGMIRAMPQPAMSRMRVPRTRGDDPFEERWYQSKLMCSPHTRG